MTASEAIRREILLSLREEFPALIPALLRTAKQIEAAWQKADEDADATDALDEAREEFRCGYCCETDVPCPGSRHYASRSVARQLADGRWVGWTFWFGGGKYGEPAAVPWIEDAYFLDVSEEEKLVVVRTFKMREEARDG